MNKKLGWPLGPVDTGKAVKKRDGPPETLPNKALKGPPADPVKKGPKSHGRKGESSKAGSRRSC